MKNYMYRLLAILHLLLGLLQLSFTSWSYFIGEPGLNAFYAGMDIDYSTHFFWYGVLITAAVMDFIFFYKLTKLKKEKLLFIAALIALCISFFLFFVVGFGKYSNVGVSGLPPEVARPF